jgi:hypothetical protein
VGSSNTDSYAAHAENDAACVVTMAQSVAWDLLEAPPQSFELSKRLKDKGNRGTEAPI